MLNIAILLLSLAAGYGVLALSNKQERPLDGLGRFIGGLILLVSLGGLIGAAVCKAACHFGRCNHGAATCGMKTMTCPISQAPAETPAAVPSEAQ